MLIKKSIDYQKLFKYLILFAPITVIIYCFSSGISGNDFWWHVKVGEHICSTGQVPTSDIFSWYGMQQGISWTAHEWLSDVVFYLIHSVFGELGIFLFSVFGAIALYFLLVSVTKKYLGKNLLLHGLFYALFGVLTSMFFYGRPHVFSYFLLFLELKFLYEFYENPSSKKVYWIPALAVLWSNLHGGSSNLTYILCIVFIVAGLFTFDKGRIESRKWDKRLLTILCAVTLACFVGILINPIGLKVLSYPYSNLSDNLSMTVISEWQAPDAKQIGNLILYFFPIVLMSIGLVNENKKVKLVDLLVMLAFLFLFFRSARFIILWYVAATFYAFKYLPELKIKNVTQLYEKIAVLAAVVLLIVPLVTSGLSIYDTAQEGMLISQAANDDAIEYIKKEQPQRLFNDYNLGEALIYSEIPVFFDARADLYAQEGIMEDGVSLMYLEQANKESGKIYVNVQEIVDKYDFDAIVILKVRPLYAYLISHPEKYECTYEDDNIGYFKVSDGGLNGN